MIHIFKMIILIAIMFTIPTSVFASNSTSPDVRLYALNCGYLDIHDPTSFASKGFYSHQQTLHLVDPCFLIKHPKGWLMWDLGVGDKYVGHETLDKEHDLTIRVPTSLKVQLKQLGLQPKDINYVAISHVHFDHTGNTNLFPHATLLIQRNEYQWLQQHPLPSGIDKNTVQILKSTHKILLNGDYDVFGDGTVEILSTPGHTPGHQSLKLTLGKKAIILSGDLYHTRRNYLYKQIPQYNTSKKDTLISMHRIDEILRHSNGQLIIQHEPGDFSRLPKFPKFLN